MSDPAEALQRAIVTLLKADAGVAALVGPRVFDFVPQDAAFPYIAFGPSQTIDDGAACIDAQESYLQLDAWSRAPGQVEAKRLAAAIRGALREAELDLGPDWQFLEIAHHDTRVLLEDDGLTAHAVVTFRALTAGA